MGKAKNAVASPHYRCLLIDAAAWIEAGDWLLDDDDARRTLREQLVRTAAATELRRRWKKIRKRGAKFAKLDARRRHQLRIDTKKLRYASEFFTSIFHSKKSIRRRKNFIIKLEAVQDALGDLNDIVVQHRLAKKAFAAGRFSKRDTARFQSVGKDAKRTFGALVKAPPFWE
jgi:CHAD domain-containing protein